MQINYWNLCLNSNSDLDKKILQINVTLNSGSTGRIVEDIGRKILNTGGLSYICYSRGKGFSTSIFFKIGNKYSLWFHWLQTRLFDRHGLASKRATQQLVRKINEINPDIIHLHNIHGYYLNIELLFNFLKKYHKPVVWTFHDCWPLTGHCTFFDNVNCFKWENQCYDCPLKKSYPGSYFIDRSYLNYQLKKKLFNSLENLTIVSVSHWLKDMVVDSFLKEHKILTIQNGVDLSVFKPSKSKLKQKFNIEGRKLILGVADKWSNRKGLDEFIKLRRILNPDIVIMLIGLNRSQLNQIPENIIGVKHISNIHELPEYYSAADVFFNPSSLESFGLVTAEAMACGTPVVVYNSTASPELVKQGTGIIVEKKNLEKTKEAILKILSEDKNKYTHECRHVAEENFDNEKQLFEYIKLYNKILD